MGRPLHQPAYGRPMVTQTIFAVLVEWYHHIVLTMSFKLVSFLHFDNNNNNMKTHIPSQVDSSNLYDSCDCGLMVDCVEGWLCKGDPFGIL